MSYLLPLAVLLLTVLCLAPKALRKYRVHREFRALRNRAAAMKKFCLDDLKPTRDSRE